MDRRFLTFWGNFLLQAAEGRRRIEDLNRWMTAGFFGADDFTKMFAEAYGLNPDPGSGAVPSADWERAAKQFRKAFSGYLDLFGAVPRSRYDALCKEKARLEKQVEEQGKAIAELRTALAESRLAEGKVLAGFEQIMKLQSEQFRQVFESFQQSFSSAFKKDGPAGS